ncbi:MAG: DUF262 domain-containing protein [Sphingomonadales bacterium]|nr:DUF262 domain-containing protein [Sphingomonadales bacterium]
MPLGQLFADPHAIRTPPYQRSFAWEQREAGRLLEDLVARSDADAEGEEAEEYFLGTMLFIEVEQLPKRRGALPFSRQPRQPRVLEVVDGLQRLTTLTMLFCIIRDLDAADGTRSSEHLLTALGTRTGPGGQNRLSLREPDERYFHVHVRTPGATRIEVPDADQSPAHANIANVRNHLRQSVGDLDAAQRRRLADFLLDKCRVVVVATAGIDRAHHIFTVLNARGKPLARNDILKADLLGGVRGGDGARNGRLGPGGIAPRRRI